MLLLATMWNLLTLKLLKKPRILGCLFTTNQNKCTPFNRDITTEKSVKNYKHKAKHRATFFLESRVSVCRLYFTNLDDITLLSKQILQSVCINLVNPELIFGSLLESWPWNEQLKGLIELVIWIFTSGNK